MKKVVRLVILAPVAMVVLIIASISIVLDWAFSE
jgi:hypothetical protein